MGEIPSKYVPLCSTDIANSSTYHLFKIQLCVIIESYPKTKLPKPKISLKVTNGKHVQNGANAETLVGAAVAAAGAAGALCPNTNP